MSATRARDVPEAGVSVPPRSDYFGPKLAEVCRTLNSGAGPQCILLFGGEAMITLGAKHSTIDMQGGIDKSVGKPYRRRRRPQDLTTINVANSEQVRYWCRLFNCTQSDLLAAVKILGPARIDVEKYVTRRAANRPFG